MSNAIGLKISEKKKLRIGTTSGDNATGKGSDFIVSSHITF